MNPSTVLSADGTDTLQVLWEDGERIFCRAFLRADADSAAVLAVSPTAQYATSAALDRLAHEYELKDQLNSAWAARPLELVRDRGRMVLVLEDTGGEPLDRLLGAPMETGRFLRLAASIAAAVGKLHRSGLIHKDLKPANILVNRATDEVKLTGFGLATRLPRERQSPEPVGVIAGTFAYMAPEQTGRMNRSIDSRSDLYALGVTFYEMLTGRLPFNAGDAMEWIHCHIARQPQAPSECVEGEPTAASAIVMKLLAKTAEDRYQTAAGLEQDLRRCLSDWEKLRRIDPFLLGERDTPSRLLIPETLYGRERDIGTLLQAFDNVLANGAPALVLVSGYSGIGKSAVVNELHKVLVPPRALFTSGKFDQYKRDIPYATLAQAFQSLTRQLLSQNENELAEWRAALVGAVGPNGRLIVDLVPELKLIIGEQPGVPELPPQQAKGRFQLTFRRFVNVFARAEHPLALFLDDLQWLDAATLELIEDLLTEPDVRHLLVIGAYRDNEVSAAHPLIRRIEAIRQSGAKTEQLDLGPLEVEDLMRLVVDSLHCEPERAAPLARLIFEKTAGNPFFAIQFISTLVDEGLVAFDHADARWRWDLKRIEAQGYTDNVVDLMVGRLGRLPAETQEALQELACLGNIAEIAMLSMARGRSEAEIDADLWEARRAALAVRSDASYAFAHDRIQHAAYSLIPEERRAEAHLRIGRLLAANSPPEKREEAIFEIVNQLNRGAALISSREEKERLAEFNLIAGKRAKAAAAYVSALRYLIAGTALLSDDKWETRPDLIFALELHRAECEFLTGELAAAGARLAMLSSRAGDPVARASVACLRIDLYTVLTRSDLAVEVCITHLRGLGIECPPHPTEEQVRQEYERMWSLLGRRKIEELVNLPLMGDPESVATLDVLTKSLSPARFTDANLFYLFLCRMVTLSLQHGNTDASCHAYVHIGGIIGPRFGDYEAGFRFGQLAYDLVELRGMKRFRARTLLGYAVLIMSWTKHWRSSRDLIRHALDALNSIGDLMQVSYSWFCLIENLLAAGDPLEHVHREAERGLAFAEKARFRLSIDIIMAQLGLIRDLRGATATFGSFNSAEFDELQFERHLSNDPGLAFPACWYWTRKLQARFLAGDHAVAIDASMNAQRLLWISPSFVATAEAHFYGALSRAASCDVASPDQYREHYEALTAHHRQLVQWARHCPENFQDRAALVGAEMARLEGRELDAERLYEAAIKSARENGFVHHEALANELAARFDAARGFETIARAYLREARSCYQRWGADGKVRQLEAQHAYLREPESKAAGAPTIEARLEQLDFATVLKVSQALSGEMVQEKLIGTLLRTALEQAGAERGLLILWRAGEPRIAAEATTRGDAISVNLRDKAVAQSLLPESVLHYVLRTRESVVIDDAATQATFAADPYVRRHKARSILCLPLLYQSNLVGALFLENRLAPGIFAPAQITLLRLVSSLAAIALENSRLYGDLREREAKIRRLVDANIIGICIVDLRGQLIEANEAFLRIVGYERADLASGRMRWTDLTPSEWRAADAERVKKVKITGILQPFEKEYLRKDGTRVPVLVGVARFEETRNQAVAFVIDLTERKRVEAKVHESERRFREAQLELEHASRVATMGQLTASIAHEVNQPLTATIGNAEATLRWLARKPPDLDESRRLLGRIIEEGRRASNVVGRIRELTRKAPPRMDRMDINGAIGEVIELTRGEAMKNGVSLRTQLAETLPLVEGDRIQLQQVMLNLIVNAIQALSERGKDSRDLLVGSAMNGPRDVVVSVHDSGPGVSLDKLGRLFDPFYTTKPDGMGMGLSICQSIIETHGGRIWVTPNIPRGAAFHFTVPIARQ